MTHIYLAFFNFLNNSCSLPILRVEDARWSWINTHDLSTSSSATKMRSFCAFNVDSLTAADLDLKKDRCEVTGLSVIPKPFALGMATPWCRLFRVRELSTRKKANSRGLREWRAHWWQFKKVGGVKRTERSYLPPKFHNSRVRSLFKYKNTGLRHDLSNELEQSWWTTVKKETPGQNRPSTSAQQIKPTGNQHSEYSDTRTNVLPLSAQFFHGWISSCKPKYDPDSWRGNPIHESARQRAGIKPSRILTAPQ